MKKAAILFLALAALSSCATGSYDTFRAREGGYDTRGITLNPVGLTAEQMKTIYATRFPKKDKVSIALFYLVRPGYVYRGYGSGYQPAYGVQAPDAPEDDLKTALVRGLAASADAARVVPVPPMLLPQALTFEAIQQIGVRTLSEYSLIVFGDTYNASNWAKFAEGAYTFNSKVDFMLVDNETTAIIAADKLISTIDVRIQIFDDSAILKARADLFAEQGKALTEKMNALFAAAR